DVGRNASSSAQSPMASAAMRVSPHVCATESCISANTPLHNAVSEKIDGSDNALAGRTRSADMLNDGPSSPGNGIGAPKAFRRCAVASSACARPCTDGCPTTVDGVWRCVSGERHAGDAGDVDFVRVDGLCFAFDGDAAARRAWHLVADFLVRLFADEEAHR